MRLQLAVSALLISAATASAQLTEAQICARMVQTEKAREATLQSYTVDRTYIVATSNGNHHAEMGVRMVYNAPGHKQFEVLWQHGGGAIQNRVMNRLIDAESDAASDSTRDRTRITPVNYDFHLLGTDQLNGRLSYILAIAPKKKSKYLIRGRIWVDAEDFAISRIEGTPSESPSFWLKDMRIVQQYQKVGGFWLVASNETNTNVRMFGPARLTIKSSGYRINPVTEQASIGNGLD